MKKSFVVFSLIGLVAIGMCFNSCSKETKPTYSYEEGWEMFDTEVAKLNQKYDQLLQDSTQSAETNVEADIILRCKYKGANSGKLMYSVLKRYCIKIQIIGLKNSIFFCFAHFFQKYLDMFIIFCTFAPS